MIRAYLDNNATTKPHDDVVAAMMPYLSERFLNASTIASDVMAGKYDPVGAARAALADLLSSADPKEFVLTSGASESNSWALSAAAPGDHVISTTIEHPSIRAALSAAVRRGVLVEQIDPESSGRIDPGKILAAMGARTRLISIMLANNETGVLQPVAEVAERARALHPDVLIHTDATQAVGRIPIDLEGELACVDLLSLSAHKVHGPKGIGALFVRSGVRLEPLIHGEQEHGWRGGTYNSMAAAGMAAALRVAKGRVGEWRAHVDPLRARFEMDCLERFPGASINGAAAERLPNTVSLTIVGMDAAHVAEQLALLGICVGIGSACSAGSNAPSPVLLAMGLPAEAANATLRVSLSIETTAGELELASDALAGLLAGQA